MFPKKNLLRKKKNIEDVLKKGKRAQCPFFTLFFLENKLAVNRFAVVVSKKTAKKAYIRNRLKRRVMEALQAGICTKSGHDMLVIARPQSVGTRYADMKSQLTVLLRNAKLMV